MNQPDHHQNIVCVKNLSFSYEGSQVLKKINLNVHKGDYLGIIGPNGGGKTTLLKCILGLLQPTGGQIELFDEDQSKFNNWSRLGYVPQKVEFDRNFPVTVKEVVVMGIYGKKGLYKTVSKNDWASVNEALKQVGMEAFADRRIGDLSGGQTQRVFIARELVSNPEVIFLDEPTVGVDVKTRDEFFELLRKLNEKLNLTLVLITHDMDIVLHHGVTEVAFINQELLFYGAPKDLMKNKFIDQHYNAGNI